MLLEKTTYSDVVGNQLNTVLVDNLVTREETSSVGVVLECLNDTKDLGHVDGVVGLPRSTTVEGAVLERRVDIENHVDTGSVEDGSAVIVVSRGSQVVHTDTVDLIGVSGRKQHEDIIMLSYTKVLQDSSIAQAGGLVAQRVGGPLEGRRTTRLVVDTNNLESVASDGVDKVLSFNNDGVDGGGGGSQTADGGKEFCVRLRISVLVVEH